MDNKGFTIFIAMIIMGTLLLISTSIVSLAVKQATLASAGRESQAAFYAADSGIECALFWDVRNPEGEQSAFSTTTTSEITCNNSDIQIVGGQDESEIEIDFPPEDYCAKVYIEKDDDGTTFIESYGYNTCNRNDPRRVERAIRATY